MTTAIAAPAVTAHDLDPGMFGKPGGDRAGVATLEHFDRAAGLQVHDDRGVDVASAQREVVDPGDPHIADRWLWQGTDQPQQGVLGHRYAQPPGQSSRAGHVADTHLNRRTNRSITTARPPSAASASRLRYFPWVRAEPYCNAGTEPPCSATAPAARSTRRNGPCGDVCPCGLEGHERGDHAWHGSALLSCRMGRQLSPSGGSPTTGFTRTVAAVTDDSWRLVPVAECHAAFTECVDGAATHMI